MQALQTSLACSSLKMFHYTNGSTLGRQYSTVNSVITHHCENPFSHKFSGPTKSVDRTIGKKTITNSPIPNNYPFQVNSCGDGPSLF